MKLSRIALLAAAVLLVGGITTAFAAASGQEAVPAQNTQAVTQAAAQTCTRCGTSCRNLNASGLCPACAGSSAQEAAQTTQVTRTCPACGGAYTDANGDGICDRCPGAGHHNSWSAGVAGGHHAGWSAGHHGGGHHGG